MFPLSMAAVRRLVTDAHIQRSNGKRVAIVFRNPTASEQREALVARFRPQIALKFYSLPTIGDVDAARLWHSIVNHCLWLSRRPVPKHSGDGPVYCFHGGIDNSPVSVVERWYHYKTLKFRSTDKLTGGANRKLLRVEERAVEIPDESQPK
jgi:hypothetical protein